MKTITLTRALAELKLIEKKLSKTKLEGLVAVSVNGVIRNNPTLSVEAHDKNAQSALDSRASLFFNRIALKEAIAKANAETTVTINGRNFSIIGAIEYKMAVQADLEFLENYYKDLRRANEEASSIIAKNDEKAEKMLDSIYGSNKNSLPKDTIEQTLKGFREANVVKVHSPMSLEDLLAKRTEMSDLIAEIDLTLSEVNSKTEIEVNF